MAKPEQQFSADFMLLTKSLHAVRVENLLCTPGLPDVSLATGWVELKVSRDYPTRPDTPVRLPHYTDDQRAWLRKRCLAGGNAWLALKVSRDWYIFWGATGAQEVGNLTKEGLRAECIAYFPGKPSAAELCSVFTGLK